MKTTQVVGYLFKAAITVALSAMIAKIVLTWYYGYKRVDASYGGTFFYNWRTKYMDKKLLKSVCTRNKMNEQPVNPVFAKYSDMVQGTSPRHVTSYNPKTKKTTYGARRTEYTYYAYGFPDTFVLGPKKTWTLFKMDPRALDLELQFLQFRGNFISELYNIKFELKNKYFERPAPPNETASQKAIRKKKAGNPIKKGTGFSKVDMNKLQKFFNNQAKMSGKLQEELMPILEDVFQGYNITVDKVNGFFTRLAKITVTPMDTHILNRFYMLMVYMFSYVDVKNVGNKSYNEASGMLSKLKGEEKAAKEGGKPVTSDTERKIKSLSKKVENIRYEKLLTNFSQIIGSILGTRGIFLDQKGDKRGWLEWYGSPQIAKRRVFKTKDKYKAND